MARTGGKLAPEDKVNVVRQHLLEGKAIKHLCDEYGIEPAQFYQWQRLLFENGAAAFPRDGDGERQKLEAEVAQLRARLARRAKGIDEVMADVTRPNKGSGGWLRNGGSWVTT